MPARIALSLILVFLPASLAAQSQDPLIQPPGWYAQVQQLPAMSFHSVLVQLTSDEVETQYSKQELSALSGHQGKTTPANQTPLGQTNISAFKSNYDLPDAPQPQSIEQRAILEIPPSSDQARIFGLVLDPTGAAISGAEITVSRVGESQQSVLKSGQDGRFSVAKLPSGSFVVAVRATGFTTFVSKALILSPQQTQELPQIVLAIAATDTEVTVRPTEQIAAEQLKAEERQRVFGLFPNYFTSYVYDASPLTARQKRSLTAHDTFDPVSLFGVAAIAGIQQAERTYPGYGNDAPGFGKRFGAALGDTLTNDFLSHAVFPAILHEDPRYFYQGSGTKKQRLYHAVSYAFVTRSD